MGLKLKYQDSNWKAKKTYIEIYTVGIATENEYMKGIIGITEGMISVYAQDTYASMVFIYGGITYHRQIDNKLSKKSLIRQALKFAKEIIIWGEGTKAYKKIVTKRRSK